MFEESLRTICAWASAVDGADSVLAAIELAVKSSSSLPTEVAEAIYELDNEMSVGRQATNDRLEMTFRGLEQHRAYKILERLSLNSAQTTRRRLAEELKVTPERVRQLERSGKQLLETHSDPCDSVLGRVARRLRWLLGTLARVEERDAALQAIGGGVLSKPSRAAAMMTLAGYKTQDQWIVDDAIPNLTAAVLEVLTKRGPVALEIAREHLSRLGIRTELQSLWIADQPDFRVVDDNVIRTPMDPVDAALTLVANHGSR